MELAVDIQDNDETHLTLTHKAEFVWLTMLPTEAQGASLLCRMVTEINKALCIDEVCGG